MIDINRIDNNIDQITFNKLESINASITDTIREELQSLFESPNAKVILDLSGIRYIDSTGFGCFLITMKTAHNNYGILKFCNISPTVLSLFHTLQLHTVFELYDDLESCIKSFK